MFTSRRGIGFVLGVSFALALAGSAWAQSPRIRVSENGRFLVRDDGTPFFYLADTAWELFHRLNREEADRYLRDRASKGFTVIQAVVLAELDGLHTPNPYGETPLFDDDPTRPNEKYFEHVDWIVHRAEELGLTIGMLPTWGDKFSKKWGKGPEIFTPENARAYGAFLGRRYRDKPIIWILGGDRAIETDAHWQVVEAMAQGLEDGDGGAHLKSYHPWGDRSSAEWFHDADWLDFNMFQSGHARRNKANYAMTERDYARRPIKPVLDGEPCYENHPIDFKPENDCFNDHDIRKAAYWSLFAGAHGHTYGCSEIWQMWQPGRAPILAAHRPWYDALSHPGSSQVQHAKNLLLSRPFLDRIPDQALIVGDPGTEGDHVRATRGGDGSYAFLYLPSGKPVTVDLSRLRGDRFQAHWYNPRNGSSHAIDPFDRADTRRFTPPEPGIDWVLVIDDAATHAPPPGKRPAD